MSRNRNRSARGRSTAASPAARELPTARRAELLRFGGLSPLLLTGAVVALQVIVPLVPSESVAQGTGVLFAQTWLVLLLLTLVVAQWRRSALPLDFASVLTWVLGGWLLLSAAVRAWDGNPRITWTVTWQWIALIASYWCVRLALHDAAARRALAAVMLSLSTLLAAHGLYQFHVSLPQQKRQYEEASEQEKQAILQANGISVERSAPERRQFEDRLLGSNEVFASFGLANSLAGVLAPWLVFAAGCIALPQIRGVMSWWRLVVLVAAFSLVLLCLVLTKSRAAWLASIAGCGVVAIELLRTGGRQAIIRLAWVLVVLAIAVVVGLASNALDRRVLTEAGLSVAYRLEYWQAAVAMMASHPLLGVGPGNFQDYYTRYKLPWSSETVADPHNLFFEAGAVGGIVAGAVLLAFVSLVAWRLFRKGQQDHRAGEAPAPKDAPPAELTLLSRSSIAAVYAGAVLGIIASLPLAIDAGFPPELVAGIDLPLAYVFGLPIFAIVLAVLHPWVRGGTLPVGLLLAAWCTLIVNLLAAGGITYPGVAQSFWLLAAVSISSVTAPGGAAIASTSGIGRGRVALLVAVALAFGCWLNATRPVRAGKDWLDRAEQAQSYDEALDYYALAANGDPWDPRPWQWMAELQQLQWLEQRDRGARSEFVRSLAEAERRDQQDFAFAMRRGWLYLRAYRVTGDRSELESSVETYRRACALYPNSNFAHAQLGWVLWLAGQPQTARDEAEQALELDRQNPHLELKLAARVLQDPVQQMDDSAFGADLPAGNAEQVLTRLRTAQDAAP